MRKTPIAYKSTERYQAQIKAPEMENETRKVSGYFAAFNNRDLDGDVLLPGCFAKSILEHGPESTSHRKIAYLWQHDLKEPIGRITMLKEDDYGLYFEAVLDDTERGEQAYKQYLSGTLNQHSIGYSYVWDKVKYDDTTDSFMVGEVILYEGSVVTIGMNENTPFTGTKGIEDAADELLKDTESFCRSLNPDIAMKVKQLTHKWHSLGEANSQPKEVTVTPPEPPKYNISEIKSLLNEQLK